MTNLGREWYDVTNLSRGVAETGLWHPRPRFVTLDPILVVDRFARTLNTLDFEMNLFLKMYITFEHQLTPLKAAVTSRVVRVVTSRDTICDILRCVLELAVRHNLHFFLSMLQAMQMLSITVYRPLHEHTKTIIRKSTWYRLVLPRHTCQVSGIFTPFHLISDSGNAQVSPNFTPKTYLGSLNLRG